MAYKVFNKYGSCRMDVLNHRARYYYQNEKGKWIEVLPGEI